MSSPIHDSPETPISPSALAPSRPMYWSIRREVWENRSVYLAPILVAAFVLFAALISMVGLPRKVRNLTADPAKRSSIVRPLTMSPAPIMLTAFLVGAFYSLDALYGERRDRSILFWKSLPVSDRTTVLAKASIPTVVLPAVALVLSVATQGILLLAGTLMLLASGVSPGALWSEFLFFEGLLIMIYGLTVHALWFAPLYAWLLLVSAWARRTPFLWAVLPLLAISAVERIAFNSSFFLAMLRDRFGGAMAEAFETRSDGDISRLSQLDPIGFLDAAGLWAGLGFAALCLFVAIRLRRNREPI